MPDFNTFVWAWIILALAIFWVNLRVKAPYGRHTLRTWGPLIDNRLAWFIMELPALLTCPIIFWLGDGPKGTAASILVGLWVLHYTHRTLIYPLRIRTQGKKMPLAIALSAITFNLVNGSICGYYLGHLADYGEAWPYSLPFVIGLALFLLGFSINIHSDNILIALRKPGETGYKIPRGGLFKYLSCPNLFGEIVEWLGFALAAFALPTATFALWTICNLIPRALAHHQWYRAKFPNYPKERKAVLPFLW